MFIEPDSSVINLADVRNIGRAGYSQAKAPRVMRKKFTAIVYCEAKFATFDGKIANGLARGSEKFHILSIIDSEKVGLDSGVVLDEKPNNIPICGSLTEALELAGTVPDYFIFGKTSLSGMLSTFERSLILEAMSHGMNIVNGVREFLNDDPVFIAACAARKVEILDVCRSRTRKKLQLFSGRITEVTCPRIAVLGTDCAIGKRTTAITLARVLNDCGLKAIVIGMGKTGVIRGVCYGVALDSIPSEYCTGELEAAIVDAFENEHPDVIIIEGQGALSHPAFFSSAYTLRGSRPNAVILQHAPGRKQRRNFEGMGMPCPEKEINLIENFVDTDVIGLTINTENMTGTEVSEAIRFYEDKLDLPVIDTSDDMPDHLVEIVLAAFPYLQINSRVYI